MNLKDRVGDYLTLAVGLSCSGHACSFDTFIKIVDLWSKMIYMGLFEVFYTKLIYMGLFEVFYQEKENN